MNKESIVADENVTKQLYKDYSAFKNDLWRNMIQNSPDADQLLLYKKTQKLLDRFLFIFFSEDSGLLPPNSISSMVQRWGILQEQDAYKPLYDIFKQFFGYINTGKKGKTSQDDIFAYNGGLFLPDNILEKIIIDDEVIRPHVMKLTAYNFESEVNVNILGHIFENSLNEIENVRAQLEGREVDKKKTKRKKDGVFYTPKYITKYIVESTVGKLCKEKKVELGIDESEYAKGSAGRQKRTRQKLFNKLEDYRKWLLNLTICDPACGSGAFLNQALEFLIAEHAYTDELEAKLFDGSIKFKYVTDQILENNLFGVDINEESVEIAKLSLWLRTAEKGRKLTSLNNNIKCGNSLIDDPDVAGELAFNWEKAFPDVFAKGGFDVVIGNPPYVRVQQLLYEEIDWYKKNKITAFKRVDISILFFEQAEKILKNGGHLSFITSNQFQNTEYGRSIRKFITERFAIEQIVDFGDLPIFDDALTYVSIYCLSKNDPKDFSYTKIDNIIDARNGIYSSFIPIAINSINNTPWQLVSIAEKKILSKLSKFNTLGEIGNAWAGLFTGLDELLMFDPSEIDDLPIENDLLLPIIRANDPIRFGLAKPSKYVLYPYKEDGDKTVVLSEDELIQHYPKAHSYLLKIKSTLQERKDSRKTFADRKDWYALTRFGKKSIFKRPKIVSPGEVKEHKFSIDITGSGFSCARVFAITVDNDMPLNGLLALLNSSLIKFFLQRIAPVKAGGYYSYSSKVLNQIPIIKNIPSEIVVKVDDILKLNDSFKTEESKFSKYVQSKLLIGKPSKKLITWYEMSFGDYLKELNKLIKKEGGNKLSKIDEMDWMEVFEAKKPEVKVLQAEIDRIDKEIDQMVYKLYELTDEEIKIVEGL